LSLCIKFYLQLCFSVVRGSLRLLCSACYKELRNKIKIFSGCSVSLLRMWKIHKLCHSSSLCTSSIGTHSSGVVRSACPKTSVNNHRRTLRNVQDTEDLLKHRYSCTLTRTYSCVSSVSTKYAADWKCVSIPHRVKRLLFSQNLPNLH